ELVARGVSDIPPLNTPALPRRFPTPPDVTRAQTRADWRQYGYFSTNDPRAMALDSEPDAGGPARAGPPARPSPWKSRRRGFFAPDAGGLKHLVGFRRRRVQSRDRALSWAATASAKTPECPSRVRASAGKLRRINGFAGRARG